MRLILIVLGLIYTLFPFDLLPDFIVGLGWLDDLGVWAILYWFLYVRRMMKEQEGQQTTYRTHQQGREGGYYRWRTEQEAAGGFGARQEQARPQPPPSSGKKDPYSVLGVRPGASSEEIKHAYRELANKYHPDKVAHLGEDFQTLAEDRFKEIQEAYQTLMPRK
ncbi:MAG: DnaJ domain-containing protein [Thermodesulfobacteriota bacterium]